MVHNNKAMATYLRFTQTAQQDIDNGFSYLKTPSMKKAKKLPGLCAFSFDIFGMNEDEILAKVKRYAANQYYLNTTKAVIIEGMYIGQNPNGEGVIITPDYIVAEYDF